MRAGDIAGVLIAAVLLPLAAACGPAAEAPSSGPGSEWQGTIETAGDVTTVVSQSGSVWGGTARLVEELSIGVQAGEPEYMLGVAATIWDDGDRIYYPDVSVPAVRVYDGSGVWLGDVGREGQGPGEYRYPYSVLTLDDGRIVVSSAESNWVDLFSPEPDFEHLERWGFSEELSAAGARLFNMLVLGVDGTPYVRYLERDPTTPDVLYDLRQGWRSIGPDRLGPVMWIPRFEYEEYRNCYEHDCSRYGILQFAPAPTATLTPEAAVVAGVGDEYRFEIHHPDGTTTVVRREYEPVALSDEERDYWMARERAEGLMRNPDYRQSWSVEMPRVKPAFERLIAARDGRILVVREGPSRRVEPCTEEPRPEEGDFEPCWASTPIWDFFGAEGRYLGHRAAGRPRSGDPLHRGRAVHDGGRGSGGNDSHQALPAGASNDGGSRGNQALIRTWPVAGYCSPGSTSRYRFTLMVPAASSTAATMVSPPMKTGWRMVSPGSSTSPRNFQVVASNTSAV